MFAPRREEHDEGEISFDYREEILGRQVDDGVFRGDRIFGLRTHFSPSPSERDERFTVASSDNFFW